MPDAIVLTAADEVAQLRAEISALRQEVGDLAAKNDWMRRLLYGSSSERRSPPVQDHGEAVQQEFLAAPVDAGATATLAAAKQSEREARAKTKNAKKGRGPDGQQKPVNGGGRTPVNRTLRVVEQVVEAPASERIGPDGIPLIMLGYEVSEREHLIPGELVRLVIKRERWGLPDTREEVVRAPVPAAIVPKGTYSDEYVLEAMLRKYLHGLPFARMLGDFRALGSDLDDSTLGNLAQRFAAFMRPIYQAIRLQILTLAFVHVDETTLPTQDGLRYLWACVGGRQAFFHVGGRSSAELRALLGDPTPAVAGMDDDDPGANATLGFLMADGYAAYDGVTAERGLTRLCCWTHGRRNFLPHEQDPFAAQIIASIGELYRIERRADVHARDHRLGGADAIAHRFAARREHAVPLLAIIHARLSEHRDRYPPGGGLRKAIDYLLIRWECFTAYTARGDLPIDNNQAERVLRPIVVGRKNWLFVGSEDATAWAAINHTIFESCRLAGVEPRAYLRHVIACLHAGSAKPEDLTPERCAQRFPMPR